MLLTILYILYVILYSYIVLNKDENDHIVAKSMDGQNTMKTFDYLTLFNDCTFVARSDLNNGTLELRILKYLINSGFSNKTDAKINEHSNINISENIMNQITSGGDILTLPQIPPLIEQFIDYETPDYIAFNECEPLPFEEYYNDVYMYMDRPVVKPAVAKFIDEYNINSKERFDLFLNKTKLRKYMSELDNINIDNNDNNDNNHNNHNNNDNGQTPSLSAGPNAQSPSIEVYIVFTPN